MHWSKPQYVPESLGEARQRPKQGQNHVADAGRMWCQASESLYHTNHIWWQSPQAIPGWLYKLYWLLFPSPSASSLISADLKDVDLLPNETTLHVAINPHQKSDLSPKFIKRHHKIWANSQMVPSDLTRLTTLCNLLEGFFSVELLQQVKERNLPTGKTSGLMASGPVTPFGTWGIKSKLSLKSGSSGNSWSTVDVETTKHNSKLETSMRVTKSQGGGMMKWSNVKDHQMFLQVECSNFCNITKFFATCYKICNMLQTSANYIPLLINHCIWGNDQRQEHGLLFGFSDSRLFMCWAQLDLWSDGKR